MSTMLSGKYPNLTKGDSKVARKGSGKAKKGKKGDMMGGKAGTARLSGHMMANMPPKDMPMKMGKGMKNGAPYRAGKKGH